MPLINHFISVAGSFFLCVVLYVCASVVGKLENSKILTSLFERLVKWGMCVCVCDVFITLF